MIEESNQTDLNQEISPGKLAWRRFLEHKPAVCSLVFLILIVVLSLAWPKISPYSATALGDAQFDPPGKNHWGGTDVHGRDLVSRIFDGARISLLVGLVGTMVSLVIGVVCGATAGYLGGRWDSMMMRVVDILYSLPSVIFVIVLITSLEGIFKKWLGMLNPSWGQNVRILFLFCGLGAVSWLTMARIIRGQVITLKTRGFVEAAEALGLSHGRILFRHIVPNLTGIIVVYLTLTIPSVILYESFLSYLGLGIQAPQASLGTLINEGARQINPVKIYWWLLALPGSFLVSTLVALNFLGEGLREAVDPLSEKK